MFTLLDFIFTLVSVILNKHTTHLHHAVVHQIVTLVRRLGEEEGHVELLSKGFALLVLRRFINL